MAKIKNITVSVGFTVNAGNYQSVRVHESIEAELQDGESCSAAITEARDYLKEKCLDDAKNAVQYMKNPTKKE